MRLCKSLEADYDKSYEKYFDKAESKLAGIALIQHMSME
jgi:hypothetical protein